MNEIEKMYENAEVKKQIPKVCSSNELYCKEFEAQFYNGGASLEEMIGDEYRRKFTNV